MVTSRRNNSHVEYWRERSEILQESLLNNGDEAVKKLDESYQKALLEIEKEVNAFYRRFADENGIDYATAKKMLDSTEIKKFRMELKEYIEKGKTLNYSKQWEKELQNASTAYRITRLKMLELQIQQQIELLYGEVSTETETTLAKIYEDGYYQQLYTLERGTGIAVDFTKLDTAGVKSIIHQSWAADGASFSERVWKYKTQLVTKLLDEVLPVAFIRGETPAKTIRTVSETMGNSWYNARLIVLTESAAYAARATQDAYNKFGVEKYEFIATLGEKTCLRCGGLESMSQDKGGLPKELYRIGSTAPPLHPHCRCTTAPYFDDLYELVDKEFLNTARPQRDEKGKTVFKANTDYISWAQEKGILTTPEPKSIKPTEVKQQDTLDTAASALENNNVIVDRGTLTNIDEKLAVANANQLNKLLEAYPEALKFAKDKEFMFGAKATGKDSWIGICQYWYNGTRQEIHLNPKYFKNYQGYIDSQLKQIESNWKMPIDKTQAPVYTITHEFGHYIQNILFEQYKANNKQEFDDMWAKAISAKTNAGAKKTISNWYTSKAKDMKKEIIAIAKQADKSFKEVDHLSDYGKTSPQEFFAEVFANAHLGNSNQLGDAMKQYLERVFE